MSTELESLLEKMSEEQITELKSVLEAYSNKKTNTLKIITAKYRNEKVFPTQTGDGYDLPLLFPEEGITIEPLQSYILDTDVTFEIPDGYFLGIYDRLQYVFRYGIVSEIKFVEKNSDNIPLKIVLFNTSNKPQTIKWLVLKLFLIPQSKNIPLEVLQRNE